MSKMEPQNPAGAAFANYQFEIYREPAGKISAVPFTFAELEQQAREKLTPGAFGYVAGGAGSEETMRANREAFSQRRIVPRMLRNVAIRDLSTTLLGTIMPAPVLLAPIGVLSIVHPDAEVAVGGGAAGVGVPVGFCSGGGRRVQAGVASV